MSLPFGLLGLLSYNDSTGYDLTRMFEDSLNNFWHAQSSQIYRELKRMEEQGLVSSRSIIQDGRPNKRLYSITGDGRRELARWLGEGRLEYENPHFSMLMRVFFGADAPEATLALLKACKNQCENIIEANCAKNQKSIESYSSLINNGRERSKYWAMTLDLSIREAKATIEWAESCITQIEEEVAK